MIIQSLSSSDRINRDEITAVFDTVADPIVDLVHSQIDGVVAKTGKVPKVRQRLESDSGSKDSHLSHDFQNSTSLVYRA